MKKIIIGILIFIEVILIALIIVLSLYKKGLLFDAPIPDVKEIYVDGQNYVNIYFEKLENGITDKIYFLYKKDPKTPDVNSKDWKLVAGNTAKYLLDDDYYCFFKNEDNVINQVEETELLGRLTSFSLNKNHIYLAIDDTYTPTLTYDVVGVINEKPYWYSDDESVATVDQYGKIYGVNKGKTKVHVKLSGRNIYLDVLVTDVIVKRPKKYNPDKTYLPCKKYNKEENDLIDKIFKERIKDAGYKTRAGVVEAARFYALEFPYQLQYFNENGRLTGNGVDGEGRYYHKGFYLDKSRFSNITKSANGPQIWGCNMYSWPIHKYIPNGLDCSGFVSWILYNGGFDPGDIGAGVTGGKKDYTDVGKRTVLTKKVEKSGKIKVGDLLSSGGPGGGHVAIIVGIDKKKYYTAESLWNYPNVGIREYTKEKFVKKFYYIMFMDEFYKKDGNITNMWY